MLEVGLLGRRILTGWKKKKKGPPQISISANTKSCPRDDITYCQGSSFAEDLSSPKYSQFKTSQRCTLAAKVVNHRSCCMSHSRVGTGGKNTFALCLALVRAHWEGSVHFGALHDNKDMTKLQ